MRGWRSVLCAIALLLLARAAPAQPTAPTPPRAAGSEVLAFAERAPHTVVGRVSALRKLDAQGWSAALRVERTLAGSAQPGARLRIAWEELAASRAVRFAEGDRVLAVLEPLPNGSLWTTRFPTRDALAIAARGDAFSRDLAEPSLAGLARYLALPAPQRREAVGVEALCALARGAGVRLAFEALQRLGAQPSLAAKLSAPAQESLVALLADAARGDALRAATLGLAGRRKLSALAPAARKLADAGGALAPAAIEALGALGALSREEAARLATGRDPALRAAALRGSPNALAPGQLAALVRSDPSPRVRAAALEALVRREGAGATGTAVEALFDADDGVKAAALRVLPAFAPEAARLLRSRIFSQRVGDPAAQRAALAGLAVTGAEGRAVLLEIESSHPDESLRELTRFLLGHQPAH